MRRAGSWLFGKTVYLTCPSNSNVEAFVQGVWASNRMQQRMLSASRQATQDGSLYLHFSYNANTKEKVRIDILSTVDHVRLYYADDDADKLLMARIQYPYFCYEAGAWMWRREEYTDTLIVRYKPVKVGSRDRNPYAILPEPNTAWEVDTKEKNLFGVIPGVEIKNIDDGGAYGVGDLWSMWRIIDRMNLTYHLMDRSNQFDSEPSVIYIDLEADQDDVDRPLAPGENQALESRSGKTGDVKMLEASGNLRPSMREYVLDLQREVQHATGIIQPDVSELSNKGSLTRNVLTAIYSPLIELTDEKRDLYGENGICKFFEIMIAGLGNANLLPRVDGKIDVQMIWPNYFDIAQEDLALLIKNAETEVSCGFTTHERALERVAKANNIVDLTKLKEELGANNAETNEIKRPSPGDGGGEPTGTDRDEGGADAGRSRAGADGD
jgi:hypothetical protein